MSRPVPVDAAAAAAARGHPGAGRAGRAGDALPTAENLRLAAAHARARDAVHEPFRASDVRAALDDTGSGDPTLLVHSAAPDRATYLQRPDLGRRLDDSSCEALAGHAGTPDLVIVVADGLSAVAVHKHAAPLVEALRRRLDGWAIGPVVVAEQARVALGDAVGEALGARMVLVLIGERPACRPPTASAPT